MVAPFLTDAVAFRVNFVLLMGVITRVLHAAEGLGGGGGSSVYVGLPQAYIIANHFPSTARLPITAL